MFLLSFLVSALNKFSFDEMYHLRCSSKGKAWERTHHIRLCLFLRLRQKTINYRNSPVETSLSTEPQVEIME